jgi:long-chain acyl-CoA synthetase
LNEEKNEEELNGNLPSKNDVFILSYTSGTTGVPKGVKLTHKMVLNVAYAVNSRMGAHGLGLGMKDCYISYLPAAHSFEQALIGNAV